MFMFGILFVFGVGVVVGFFVVVVDEFVMILDFWIGIFMFVDGMIVIVMIFGDELCMFGVQGKMFSFWSGIDVMYVFGVFVSIFFVFDVYLWKNCGMVK